MDYKSQITRLMLALIPAIAVPVSLIGTFAVLLVMGYPNSAQALIAKLFAEGQKIRTATVTPFNLPPIIGRRPPAASYTSSKGWKVRTPPQ